MQKFLEICCSEIDLYLSNQNRFWKSERGFSILVCYDKTSLSIILYSFSFSRHMYFKNMCQTGEFWDLKFRAHRWILFSQYVTPVGKLREVIVLWFVVIENLSQVFEIHFHLPDICISKTCVKQENYEIQKLGLKYGFDSPNMWHL